MVGSYGIEIFCHILMPLLVLMQAPESPIFIISMVYCCFYLAAAMSKRIDVPWQGLLTERQQGMKIHMPNTWAFWCVFCVNETLNNCSLVVPAPSHKVRVWYASYYQVGLKILISTK